MIRTLLPKLMEKQDLTADEITECLQEMMTGAATDAQIGSFLTALRLKGERPEELKAAALAVRAMAKGLNAPFDDLVDTCGTGGDYSSSFNVSTAAALIAAGAGAKVAKHGNRSASSQAGSADVVEALGIQIEVKPELTERRIKETGFGFLFAPLYHPAMKFVAGPRRELGLRTLFNMVGPLVNPARVRRQLIGVWDPSFLDLFGGALRDLGCERAMVVWGGDGLDEITLTTSTEVCELKDKTLKRYTFDPKELGIEYCKKEDLKGGDAQANAGFIEAVLRGEDSPRRDVSALNAAAVLYVAGKASDLKEGFSKANEAIDSGRAFQVLQAVRRMNPA